MLFGYRRTAHALIMFMSGIRMQKNPFQIWKSEMSSAAAIIDETRQMIEVIGGPCDVGTGRERWLEQIARRVGLSPSRVAGLFYRKVRMPRADEYLTIKAKADEIHARNQATRQTLAELRDRLRDDDSGGAVQGLGRDGRMGDEARSTP